jgi:hypothetical protein
VVLYLAYVVMNHQVVGKLIALKLNFLLICFITLYYSFCVMRLYFFFIFLFFLYFFFFFLLKKTNICAYRIRRDTVFKFLLHVLAATCHHQGIYTPRYLKHNKI